MRLDGKVAIITGGSGGIGAATAQRFVREGAHVLLVDRDEAALRDVASRLASPSRVAFRKADVSTPEDTDAYVSEAVSRFGGVDVLFANAGIEGKLARLVDSQVEDFDRVIAVNLRGVYLGLRRVANELAKRGGGSIVITSSVAGVIGSAGLGPYVASKHAVIGLMKAAAIELAPLGIRVNTLNPGPIDNRMMRSIEHQGAPEHPETMRAGFTKMVPLGRYGTNEEMADVALFLASHESSYCTGAIFLADGGFTTG